MNFLIVGGNFDDNGGRPSSMIRNIAEDLSALSDVTLHNGGYYDEIKDVLESAKNYDAVFWCPNIPNDKPKLRDVKSVAPRAMLITSKRNDNEKYSFQELINRALGTKSNLCVEFAKTEDKFKMMLFDPLGNAWYDGFDIKELVQIMYKRVQYLSEIAREGCKPMNETLETPDNPAFFDIVKGYAEVFHELIHPEEGVTRFLGNSSFRSTVNETDDRTRCERGFPSFRGEDDLVYVSRRNVDKRYIDKENFVPVKLSGEGVLYSGEYKPSVDTPIQLRLYNLFPQINYMIHAHVYVDGGIFTDTMVPCGGLQEVNEVFRAIAKNGFLDEPFYAVNLTGHGCLIMSDDVEKLKNLPFKGRVLPEFSVKNEPEIERE